MYIYTEHTSRFCFLDWNWVFCYLSPQEVGQAVDVLADLLVLAAVLDIDPGAEEREARPEDKVEDEGERAEPEPLEYARRNVRDDHDGAERGGGAREREYVLAVVVLHEVVVEQVHLGAQLVQILGAHRLAAHLGHGVEAAERLVFDLPVGRLQVLRMHVWPIAAAVLLHGVYVELFGERLGRQVVGLGGGAQHRHRLGQLARLEYPAVGAEVLEQLESGDLATVDLLHGQVGRESALDELLHVHLEFAFNIWLISKR